MTAAAAGVLTGLAKLKRQDSARSQHRSLPPGSPGLGNPNTDPVPRCSVYCQIFKKNVSFAASALSGFCKNLIQNGFFLHLERGSGALMWWWCLAGSASTRPPASSSSWDSSSWE